jgi:hypothetical protein
MHVAEARQQVAMVARECTAIGAQQSVDCFVDLVVLQVRQQVLDRNDQWRIADELWPPVNHLQEFVEGLDAVLGPASRAAQLPGLHLYAMAALRAVHETSHDQSDSELFDQQLD